MLLEKIMKLQNKKNVNKKNQINHVLFIVVDKKNMSIIHFYEVTFALLDDEFFGELSTCNYLNKKAFS